MNNWSCPICLSRYPQAQPGSRCPQDQAVLVPAATLDKGHDPLLGSILAGRYAIFDLLGQGGFGSVYRAIQEPLGREVAVKVIRPDATGAGADPRDRFFHEARLLAQLRSPGIVRVFDYGEEDGRLYMVLELIPGRPLGSLMGESLSVARVIDLMAQILDALSEPHEAGLVHRDLKPDNILVVDERDGRQSIKVIDFGIAKVLKSKENPNTRTGLLIGTPKYMAPEQLRNQAIGPWTDQYALGVMLYKMLTGTAPFDGTTAEIAVGHLTEAPPPFARGLGLPRSLERVIIQALSKDPQERFEDVRAMRSALLAAEGNSRVLQSIPSSFRESTISETLGELQRPSKQESRWPLWLGIFMVLILGMLGGYSLMKGEFPVLESPNPDQGTPVVTRIGQLQSPMPNRQAVLDMGTLKVVEAIAKEPSVDQGKAQLRLREREALERKHIQQKREALKRKRTQLGRKASENKGVQYKETQEERETQSRQREQAIPKAPKPRPSEAELRAKARAKARAEARRMRKAYLARISADVGDALSSCRCRRARKLLSQLKPKEGKKLRERAKSCRFPAPGQRCINGKVQ